jgi:hypothetical protein
MAADFNAQELADLFAGMSLSHVLTQRLEPVLAVAVVGGVKNALVQAMLIMPGTQQQLAVRPAEPVRKGECRIRQRKASRKTLVSTQYKRILKLPRSTA